jgi:RNA polymerase sigma-70 factor (ECF subfamily)
MGLYHSHTDLELMVLISGDDELAFAEIYQRYKGVLFLHAYRILGSEEEAKDILQDLFAKLWTKRASINLKTTLSAYLYSSVRNRIFDLIAHKKVEEKYISSLAWFIEEGECITDHLMREKELSELIEKEIAMLPPKMREVFLLSRKQNLSHKEIADELNISDKTVKKQVNNALNILREKLDNAFILVISLMLI